MSTSELQNHSSKEIPKHDGRKSTYQAYRSQVLDMASVASSLFQFGLMAFILGIVEYQLFTPDPFIQHQPPGAQPLLNQAQAWAVWKWNAEQYAQQMKDLNAFRLIFIASISGDMFALLNEPVFGMRRHTLEHILAQMDLKYGTLTTADLIANEAILRKPFVDEGTANQITSFVSNQRFAHTVAAANLQPFAEAVKVRFLKMSVLPCGLFNDTVNLFEAQLPTVALQSFGALSARLEAFDDNRSVTLTAGGLNYAAAVHTTTGSSQVPSAPAAGDVAAIVAAIAPLIAAAVAGPRTPAAAAPPVAPRPPRIARHTSQLMYCYSHGQCAHTSGDCGDKFRPGHRDDATLARPLGGETGVWTEIKRARRSAERK